MNFIQKVQEIIRKVSFRGPNLIGDLDIEVRDKNGVVYLQVVSVNGVDNDTGQPAEWRGRKWMLSEFMVESEIVRTAYKAIQAAIEHEMAEKFKYMGQSIYDPHWSVKVLAQARDLPFALDERPNGLNAA